MDTSILPQLGSAGACVAVVIIFLKYLKDDNERRDKINAEMAKAIDKMANSNDKVAKEIRQGNKESAARNGHLGEQNLQIINVVEKISGNLHKQTIEHQVVKDSTVEKLSIKDKE